MPAGGGIGAAVAADVIFLLRCGHLGSLARIEAYGDHVELVADIKLYEAHGAGEAGQSFAAQHGAVVINQIQDERFAAEVITEPYGLSGFVAEGEIGRQLRVEMLLDTDVLKARRPRIRGRGHYAAIDLRRSGAREQRDCECNEHGGDRIFIFVAHFFTTFVPAAVLFDSFRFESFLLAAAETSFAVWGRTGSPR